MSLKSYIVLIEPLPGFKAANIVLDYDGLVPGSCETALQVEDDGTDTFKTIYSAVGSHLPYIVIANFSAG